ncbi:MAG TPA: P-loop NTPase, partial [Anaerolineae bacterium]
DIFAHGGAAKMAEKFHVPFLTEITLDVAIREGGDGGKPITATHPDSPNGQAFKKLAQAVAAAVSVMNVQAAQGELIAGASIPILKR